MNTTARWLLVGMLSWAGIASAAAGAPEPEPAGECIPNGSIESLDAQGKPTGPALSVGGKASVVVEPDGNHALRLTANGRLEWDMPNRIIWDGEYAFSCRVKGRNLDHGRVVLWTRLPVVHEPPNGPIFQKAVKGTFDWQTQELRFRMPVGITRFIVFFEVRGADAELFVDDLSLRPVNPVPLLFDPADPSFGDTSREPLVWIWTTGGFPWSSAKMGNDASQPVPHARARFRRTLSLPPAARDAEVIFTGDDVATLWINGREIASNQYMQDIARCPIAAAVKPGVNEIQFAVENDFGPGGLLARVQWTGADGQIVYAPTNDRWECSDDDGKTWRPAAVVAAPAPAPTQFHWVYPHLPKLAASFVYALPADLSAARLAVRSTGGFALRANGQELLTGASAGQIIRVDLRDRLRGARHIELTLEDIAQPPAGQAVLELTTPAGTQTVPLSAFKAADDTSPTPVQALYPARTWPINVGAFESASTRPPADWRGRLEPWAESLLAGATPLWRIGTPDDSSQEFAPLDRPVADVAAPSVDPRQFPRGLEKKLRPEQTIRFDLPAVPAHGAALVLSVEDADAVVNSVGIFVNGTLVGLPQVLGYDQVPGGRVTNRSWVVTIPPERFIAGTNTLTLRLLDGYYNTSAGGENQAEEYIRILRLRDRSENPYPTSAWLHWDTLTLSALARTPARPINGRPVTLGANLAYLQRSGAAQFDSHVFRDLQYLGLAYTNAPLRIGVWDAGQFKPLTAPYPGAPGQTVGDHIFGQLRATGMRPYLLFEPGRGVNTPDVLEASNEAAVVRRFGQYIDIIEIGNEVDAPYYGWDALQLSIAYATIQRQAVCGQMLKRYDPDNNLATIGQGWYHAWDFSVMDAQARRETAEDPGFTEALSAHSYGQSYIIPAVAYHTLYGANLPAPVWVTECGSWTPDDTNISAFDLNLRGNIGYATYIVQYLLHPYSKAMERFSLFSADRPDARVLEKARCYRRLVGAFSTAGRAMPWRHQHPDAMRDRLVFVNPIETDAAWKVTFVNFSREPQPLAVEVDFPAAGAWTATRYGDGPTVAEGTRSQAITAQPKAVFTETLAPGETVEYLIPRQAGPAAEPARPGSSAAQ